MLSAHVECHRFLNSETSQDVKLSVPEIKESSLPDNPGHKPGSGSSLSQNFSDV